MNFTAGATLADASADAIVKLSIGSAHTETPFNFRVDVLKTRKGSPSTHSFSSLADAIEFISEFVA